MYETLKKQVKVPKVPSIFSEVYIQFKITSVEQNYLGTGKTFQNQKGSVLDT